MSILFKTNGNIDEYVKHGKNYSFPGAPCRKCPKCGKYIRFRKHGYRRRWIVSCLYKGVILIRRYICPCKHFTISMIPDFCLRCYSTAFEHVFGYTFEAYNRKTTFKKLLETLNAQNGLVEISRQLLYFYRKRFLKNIKCMEVGIRSINPIVKLPDKNLSEYERAKVLLEIVKTEFTILNELSLEFHNKTNTTPFALIKLL